jgi:hypothetical protein
VFIYQRLFVFDKPAVLDRKDAGRNSGGQK